LDYEVKRLTNNKPLTANTKPIQSGKMEKRCKK